MLDLHQYLERSGRRRGRSPEIRKKCIRANLDSLINFDYVYAGQVSYGPFQKTGPVGPSTVRLFCNQSGMVPDGSKTGPTNFRLLALSPAGRLGQCSKADQFIVN